LRLQRKRVDVHHHYHPADSEDKRVVRKDCAWCKGTGKVRDIITGREKKCDVCGGEGCNSFRPPPEQCRPCNGTGVGGRNLVMSSRIKCDVCKGKGWHEI